MTSALQNRLVGTIILVAIAVIFLPDLLDSKKEAKRNLFVELPQKPPMKKVTQVQEFDTEQVRQAASRKIEIINEPALDDTPETDKLRADLSQDIETKNPGQAPPLMPNDSARIGSLGQATVIADNQQQLLESAGWVVQLGSFRHQENVRELLSKLQKAGYRAFSRPVQTSSGELTKVFVGPDLQKEKLEKAISHLKELTNLQGRVTPFTVQ
ncbi:MAG: DedD protein [Paraglaciecola sp.]